MNTTDVIIECRGCGLIASEHEFGNSGEELICPQCKNGGNLWDYEPLGDKVNTAKDTEGLEMKQRTIIVCEVDGKYTGCLQAPCPYSKARCQTYFNKRTPTQQLQDSVGNAIKALKGGRK